MRRKVIDKRYKILKKLGTGATGDVYKVRNLKDKKITALKILSKKKTSSELVQRFKREFRLLAELHHPNLCEVYDFGTLKDGRSYFTMEYIDGVNIFEFTKNPVRKNISDEIFPLIVQLCRVLEYIHSRGLIHYDVKPDNVLIQMSGESGDGRVKLMDFGLVGEQRIKGGILIRGTLPYIAPEVIKGIAIDHRADLYSLGVLLYEIFTRKRLRIDVKSSFATLLQQSINRITEKPSGYVIDIPKRLERLVVKLTDTEPGERFSRANEVIKEINKLSGLKFGLETEKTLEGYLLSSKFVDRNREMGLLKSLYEKARQGDGNVVLITGDAGIGKSRLLKEFKISAQLQRSHCFTGSAYRDKVGPLEPFYEIFKELINYIKFRSVLSRELKLSFAVLFKLFPDLADKHLKKKLPKLVPLEPQQEKLRTFEALSELIGYCTSNLGELVILLEDLHWVDDLSIQFLEYLGRNIEGKNILICGTSRSEELKENLVLQKMTRSLKNEGCFHQLELKPLKFKTLYSFLDSTITPGSNSSELARYLMKKTGGNPFFVEEIMRTLLRTRKVGIGERVQVEDLKRISIPVTIENIVLKRIKVLDSASQKVVKFGAVMLKDFSYDLIKQLTGLEDVELSKALWELKNRQVLVEEGNRYRFYHATLREAINKRMAYREKRKLYYQSGKTLELIYKRNTQGVVEDLAYYFINAKDRKKGVGYGLRAAKKSSERYANEQAIRFYKGVLGLLSNKDIKQRFDMLQELANIENHAGYCDDAIRHYNKALNLRTGAIDKKIRVCLRLSQVYAPRGEYNKALHIYQKGIRFLKKMKSGRLKALLETAINVKTCRAKLQIGDYKSVNKFNFNTVQSLTSLSGRPALELLVDIYLTLGTIEAQKRERSEVDRAISYYNKAYRYCRKIGDVNKAAVALGNLGVCYQMKYKFCKTIDCYQKAIQLSEKIGNQYGVSVSLYNLANIFYDQGRYSKALDLCQRCLAISKRIGNPFIMGGSLLGLGHCYLSLCDYKRAKEHFEKALRIFHATGLKFRKVSLIMVMGTVYRIMGDNTSALRLYRKASKMSRDIGGHPFHRDLLFIEIGSIFIEIGEISRAKRHIDDATKIATASGLIATESKCYICLCRINILMKDYATAIGYYKKGIKLARKIGRKSEVLRFFLLVSEIYYHGKKYLKGIKTANKAIKLAKEMGTKDLHAEALLNKAKNEIKQGALSKIEILGILNEAKRIAEEIECPEVLWKVYFEYGRFLQDDKQYFKALDYYDKCNDIFDNVCNRIKNKSYQRSYLDRPDRQAVYAAKNEIARLLD